MGVERTARARVAAAWLKWREVANLLVNRGIPLKSRAGVYQACITLVMLYGAETWALTRMLMEVLRAKDRGMLMYMAGIRWQDRVSSADVANRCGVEDLETVLRRERCRWFGHVKNAGEDTVLEGLEVEGRRPVGRPRKTWRRCTQDGLALMGLDEHRAEDRVECHASPA